jgi:tape measure domain-containing protein
VEKLSWMFELLDRMSGPADRIAKSLKKLDPALKTSAGQTSFFSRMIGGVATTFGPKAAAAVVRFAGSFVNLADRFKAVMPVLKPIGSALGKLGSVAGKGLALAGTAMVAVGVAAAAAVGGLAVAGGKFLIDSIAFKETTLASLEAIAGSKEAAEEIFNSAVKFAAKTPFSTSQVAAAFEKLVAAGVEVKDLEKTMQSLGDFAGTDINKLESAIGVIAQIKGKGKLQGEELMQLAERGLPMGKVLDQLAKKMGKTKDEVQKLLSDGKISSDVGIGAIMAVIGGTFGGRMEKASNTLEGLWSTLKSVPEDILFNPASAAAIEKMVVPIKALITAFTQALSPDTANGKRLIAMFTQISDTVVSVLGGVSGKGVAETIGSILNVAEPLLTIFLAFGKSVLGGMGDVLGEVVKWLGALKNDPETLQALVESFVTLGKALGMALGIVVVTIGAILALQAAIASWIGDFIGGTIELMVWLDGLRTSIEQFFVDMWNRITNMSWRELGIAIVQGIITGILAMISPAGSAMSLLGDTLFNTIQPGGTTPTGGTVQPGGAPGSTTGNGQGAAGAKTSNVAVSVPQIIINAVTGEDPAAAGQRAGDSFMSSLGAALKGLGAEAGG